MGKFLIRKTNTGFMFSLKAANGEVIATSESYASADACRKGIYSVKNICLAAEIENQSEMEYTIKKNPKFEIYIDKSGEYRFRLKAKNGQIVAVGEGYKTVNGCIKGINSVMKNAPEADIYIQ